MTDSRRIWGSVPALSSIRRPLRPARGPRASDDIESQTPGSAPIQAELLSALRDAAFWIIGGLIVGEAVFLAGCWIFLS